MDKTVEEITDENAIRAICFPTEDIKRALPKIKEPIKLALPSEPPIYMRFYVSNSDILVDIVYIADNTSKTIIMFRLYNSSSNYSYYSIDHLVLKPNSKFEGYRLRRHDNYDINKFRSSILNFIIIYEDYTYIVIPKRIIEAIISDDNDDNFEKADKKLEEILREAQEAKERAQREAEEKAKQEAEKLARQKAEEKARMDACCAEIKKYAIDFLNTRDDLTAESLLNKLNEYCPNDEVMAANYLTKDNVASACGKALQLMVFYTNTNVTQTHRDEAKAFLERIAPDLLSEKSFEDFKNSWMKKLRSEIDSRARNFQNTPNDLTANALVTGLNAYCPSDEVMAANYLTKEIVASACGEALQLMVFYTNTNVTQTHRDEAKAFLERIAPDLLSEKSFEDFKNSWIEKLRSEMDTHASSFLNKPNANDAELLLANLNEYCPNDEVMAANYLTKKDVASACGKALQTMVFSTNHNVTSMHRDAAKSFLKRFAPELNSLESYKRANPPKKMHGCLRAIIIVVAAFVGFILLLMILGIVLGYRSTKASTSTADPAVPVNAPAAPSPAPTATPHTARENNDGSDNNKRCNVQTISNEKHLPKWNIEIIDSSAISSMLKDAEKKHLPFLKINASDDLKQKLEDYINQNPSKLLNSQDTFTCEPGNYIRTAGNIGIQLVICNDLNNLVTFLNLVSPVDNKARVYQAKTFDHLFEDAPVIDKTEETVINGERGCYVTVKYADFSEGTDTSHTETHIVNYLFLGDKLRYLTDWNAFHIEEFYDYADGEDYSCEAQATVLRIESTEPKRLVHTFALP